MSDMLKRRDFLKAVVALTGLAASPLAVTRFQVPELTLEEKKARARMLMGEQLDYTWIDESRAAEVFINGKGYVFTRTPDEEGARWHRVGAK